MESASLPLTQTYTKEKRMPELDGLRGVAILQVLIWHYFVYPLNPQLVSPFLLKICALTWSGVDLFFVLSGFLLGGILIDHKNAVNYFKVFYIRRFCRIFPIYYLWILLFIIIVHVIQTGVYMYPYIMLFDTSVYHKIPLWHYITYTQNFAMAFNHDWGNQWFMMTWSLAIEEQFYLVLPLIIFLTPARFLQYVLLFFIVLAPVLRTLLIWTLPVSKGVLCGIFLMPCRCDSLLLGVLCAWALRQNGYKEFIQRHLTAVYLIAGLLICWLWSMNFRGEGVLTRPMTMYGYSLLAIFYSLILLIIMVQKEGDLAAIMRNRWLGKLGIISYSTYIFHQAVSGLVHGFILHSEPQIIVWSNAWVSLLALCLTVLFAWVSWTFFEKPIVHFGHSWGYKDRGQ